MYENGNRTVGEAWILFSNLI